MTIITRDRNGKEYTETLAEHFAAWHPLGFDHPEELSDGDEFGEDVHRNLHPDPSHTHPQWDGN